MFDFGGISGFIFDCDGTLLDSMGAWDDAERDLFAEAGPLSPEDEAQLHASDIEDACALLHGKFGVGESAEALFAYFEGRLMDYYLNHAEALPGAVEFVHAVRSAGIPCVVLSSSPRRYLEAGLKRAGLLDCFDALVTTAEAGVPKTDPAIYEHAMGLMGSSAHDTWAVDDAPYAVAVMAGMGLRTVCPINGAEENRPRVTGTATLVVDTLQDLL